MFETVQSRFALRASLVGVAALFSSLAASSMGSDLTMGEGFLAISSGIGAALAYAGVGRASASVEPSINKK